MEKNNYLTICYSCYKEGSLIIENLKRIDQVIKKLPFDVEVLVVDDLSPDDSFDKITNYIKSSNSSVKLIKNCENLGFAKTFVVGAMHATGRYYRLSAGDDATNLDDLLNLYMLTGHADMIIPYNVQSEMDGKPSYRKYLSNFYTLLVNLLTGNSIRYYNGLPIYVRDDVLLWHPVTTGFGWQSEMICNLLDRKKSYIEIYTKNAEIKDEYNSITKLNFFSVAFTLIRLIAQRIKKSLFS